MEFGKRLLHDDFHPTSLTQSLFSSRQLIVVVINRCGIYFHDELLDTVSR